MGKSKGLDLGLPLLSLVLLVGVFSLSTQPVRLTGSLVDFVESHIDCWWSDLCFLRLIAFVLLVCTFQAPD